MAAKHKPRRTDYEAKVNVEVEQTRAPLMWPGDVRKHFKAHGYDPNTAKGWYKWRMDQGAWSSILWLPEEKAAIVQLGPGKVTTVQHVGGVVEALQTYVHALA